MQETKMDKITTEMAEYICDMVCGNLDDVSNDEADRICDECRMGQFMCDILNEYNRINDFEKSQCSKLLKRIAELESK